MPQKDVFFVNVGCQKTNLDSLRAKRYCESNGWRTVVSPREASLICVGTCTVTDSMERRSRMLVERMIRENPHARVVVNGCLTAIKERRQVFSRSVEMFSADSSHEWERVVFPEKNQFEGISGFDPYFTEKIGFTETFWERAKRYLFDFGLSTGVLTAFRLFRSKLSRHESAEKPAYLLEISRGCLEECSYCATRFARGKLRSRPLKEIIQEFSQASRWGFKKFVLVASDTGCYGLDVGSSFVELLSALFAASCDLQKLVIPDFNVKWLIKDHAKLVPIFSKHQGQILLHAMAQHVNDRLLALMKRGYGSQDMLRYLLELRQKAPRLAIATNIIVGFPSESHEEFRQLIVFLKRIRFNKVLVYKYSPRPQTVAAQMKEQVSAYVKLCRMLRLEATQLMINLRRGMKIPSGRIKNGG